MQEIERKFLLSGRGNYKEEALRKTQIEQGYLNSDPERTVRVRIKGKKGFLTVKGASNEAGTTRFEWETEIEFEEAKKLIELCEPGIIEKLRYEVKFGNHIFEVDEFMGENKGLTLVEIELTSEEEDFQKPEWLGKEVTGQQEYYNSYLSKNPYKNW